jgi:hypothetical protein
MTTFLIHCYLLGSAIAIPLLAIVIATLHRRVAERDARIGELKRRETAMASTCDSLLLAQSLPPPEPPPGVLGATATTRAERARLAELSAAGRPPPWRRTLVVYEDHSEFEIVGDGDPMPAVGYLMVESDQEAVDSALIIEARNMAAALLADVETLLGDVACLERGLAEVIAERDTALALAALPDDRRVS